MKPSVRSATWRARVSASKSGDEAGAQGRPGQQAQAELAPLGGLRRADVDDPVEPGGPLQQGLVNAARMVGRGDDQQALVVLEAVQLVQEDGPVVLMHQAVEVFKGQDAGRELPGALEDGADGVVVAVGLQVADVQERQVRQGGGDGLADHRLARSGRPDEQDAATPGEAEGGIGVPVADKAFHGIAHARRCVSGGRTMSSQVTLPISASMSGAFSQPCE